MGGADAVNMLLTPSPCPVETHTIKFGGAAD